MPTSPRLLAKFLEAMLTLARLRGTGLTRNASVALFQSLSGFVIFGNASGERERII